MSHTCRYCGQKFAYATNDRRQPVGTVTLADHYMACEARREQRQEQRRAELARR